MIVAAHQPNFIPWLGFFDKMRQADLFILVDHVQFERRGFQNRTLVKTSDGPRWLTVPVVQRSRDERIADKLIDNNADCSLRWRRKMLRSIECSYRPAGYLELYKSSLAAVLEHPWERLSDLNEAAIAFCREALGIRTPMVRSSELDIRGAKSEMVLNLCLATGADTYLSGTGASRDYLDLEAFERAGVRVRWQDFRHPRYLQHPDPGCFVERLSALDLLLNCGPQSGLLLGAERELSPAA